MNSVPLTELGAIWFIKLRPSCWLKLGCHIMLVQNGESSNCTLRNYICALFWSEEKRFNKESVYPLRIVYKWVLNIELVKRSLQACVIGLEKLNHVKLNQVKSWKNTLFKYCTWWGSCAFNVIIDWLTTLLRTYVRTYVHFTDITLHFMSCTPFTFYCWTTIA